MDNDVNPGTVASAPLAISNPGRSGSERRNQRAFAALKADGSVVTWGDSFRGGDSNAVADKLSSGVVAFANPLTDDQLIPRPVITLAVAPASVTEDGLTNLIYTFTRTGTTTSGITVNYTVGGTAVLGSDYTGIASTPGTKTISFAAGSTTATVTVDPTADPTIEPDETVALTLAAGTGYSIGTPAAVTGTIANDDVASASTFTLGSDQSTLQLLGTKRINGIGNNLDNLISGNASNNRLCGGLGKDVLTGINASDSDIFVYNSLDESLLVNPSAATAQYCDEITDFNSNDRILAPLSIESERLIAIKGTAASLSAAAISGVLSTTGFVANSVAAFAASGFAGTFIAMNDGNNGFQADSDAIIFLRNYSISAANFVDFI